MTCSKVKCNSKYILWSKLYVGLVSVITSLEVFSSILLTPCYSAVSGRRGMAAAMHCVSRRDFDSSAFPLGQLVPSSLVPFPFCIWQLSLYQQVQFQWGPVFCSLS